MQGNDDSHVMGGGGDAKLNQRQQLDWTPLGKWWQSHVEGGDTAPMHQPQTVSSLHPYPCGKETCPRQSLAAFEELRWNRTL